MDEDVGVHRPPLLCGLLAYCKLPLKKFVLQVEPKCTGVETARWPGESLHTEYNNLFNMFNHVVCKLDRLAMIMKQHESSLPIHPVTTTGESFSHAASSCQIDFAFRFSSSCLVHRGSEDLLVCFCSYVWLCTTLHTKAYVTQPWAHVLVPVVMYVYAFHCNQLCTNTLNASSPFSPSSYSYTPSLLAEHAETVTVTVREGARRIICI